ncbi:MAG: hypothetical protein Q8905_11600, partial [Bacteroidota bacterium]|nr:hypothetical protein [Bacteroidota bacterium]
MPLISLTIPVILCLCLSIIWLIMHSSKNKEINFILTIILLIVVYNLLVINGHLSQLPLYHQITTRLTYSDALLFFL